MSKKRYHETPRLARRLLRLFIRKNDRQYLLGDLEEHYKKISNEKGAVFAYCWYWLQALIPFPGFISTSIYGNVIMSKNYIKIALRNLWKHKGYSFINIFGFSAGLACCIVILLFVQDELSYDAYHENADNIVRMNWYDETSGISVKYARVGNALPPAVADEIAEVKSYTRVMMYSRLEPDNIVIYKDKKYAEERMMIAEPTFFDIFSHTFIHGNKEDALIRPNTVVLTRSTAQKLFDSDNPIKKVLRIGTYDFEVSAVIEDVPHNSHFKFDYLISYASIPPARAAEIDKFRLVLGYNYLLLEENVDLEELSKKIDQVYTKHTGQEYGKDGYLWHFRLQKLKDVHLNSGLLYELSVFDGGNTTYVYLFSAIAFIILGIAAINFMNLSTSRAARRSKEVGLRKVVGAKRHTLVSQFLGESLITTFVSGMLAIVIAFSLMDVLNTVTGKNLDIAEFMTTDNVLFYFVIVGATGLISGLYPAIFLSALQPIKMLKGTQTSSHNSILRKSLVIVQFSISVILISWTFTVYRQLEFMKTKDLGFNTERVVTFDIDQSMIPKYKTLKSELLSHQNIIAVSMSKHKFGKPIGGATRFEIMEDGKVEGKHMKFTEVDYDFVKTFQLKIVQGREFSEEYSTDAARGFMLNETAAKYLGWGEDAVGQQLTIDWPFERTGVVIGVIKDYHHGALQSKIDPAAYLLETGAARIMSVRMGSSDIPGAIGHIENVFYSFAPDKVFSYSFLDDDFNREYIREENQGKLFTYFSFIAILIASLGLLGLASFTAEQKTREIGIRKVLGSSVSGLITNLSSEFMKWVIVANVIAWPVAYYVVSQWLSGFAYRTDVGISIFVLSSLLSLIVAAATIVYQIIKAAMLNPVTALRYE